MKEIKTPDWFYSPGAYKKAGQSGFTVPPLETITGKSVMPADSPLVLPVQASEMRTGPLEKPHYTKSYLKKYIGCYMRVQFFIGLNGPLIDKTGILNNVGEDYIVLKTACMDDLVMCDLYSIKFVTIYR